MAKCRHVLSLCTSLRNNPSQLYQSLLGQLNEYAMNTKINFRVCMNEESDTFYIFGKSILLCKDHLECELYTSHLLMFVLYCLLGLLLQLSCSSLMMFNVLSKLLICCPIFVPTVRHIIANK